MSAIIFMPFNYLITRKEFLAYWILADKLGIGVLHTCAEHTPEPSRVNGKGPNRRAAPDAKSGS
jgi:hypothetical protein